MFRIGSASDKENAYCLYRQEGRYTLSLLLSGFGTKPMPGQICDNAIQKVVDFAGHYIQNTLSLLLEKECTDMELAKKALTEQMKKVSKGIAFANRNIGQGCYVVGCVAYIVDDRYICLPFGSAYACRWDNGNLTKLRNTAICDASDYYIWDALGTNTNWQGVFEEGILHIGNHLILASQAPDVDLMDSIMANLSATDPNIVANSIYTGLDADDMPRAAMDMIRYPNLQKEE